MTAVESSQIESSPDAPPVRGSDVEVFGARYHLWILVICSVVVSLSLLLSTQGPEQVIVPGLNRPLPGMCMSRTLFGMDCPGCGMTRCFVSLARGDVAAAWHFNPAGLMFFALVVSQIPLRAYQLRRIRRGLPEWPIGRYQWPLFVVVGAMLLQWIVKTAAVLFA